jgi:hypothetical protein
MRKGSKILLLFLLSVCAASAVASEQAEIRFGAAKIEITPRDSILMNGYASRIEPSAGVLSPLQARALAIRDIKQRYSVVLTLDLVTIHHALADRIANHVQEKYQIPRERLLINASHTHTGPVVYGTTLEMGPITEAELTVIKKYAVELDRNLFTVIDNALQNMEPGTIKYGCGRADFGMNRRIFTSEGVKFGANPEGPVDPDVPVLALFDTTGAPRAIVFGYACHATSLRASRFICADFMGFARDHIEMVYPETTALFIQGCCGDINPYPRGGEQWVKVHGLTLAGAVTATLTKEMQEIRGDLVCNFQMIDLELEHVPALAELDEIIADTTTNSGRIRQQVHLAQRLKQMLLDGQAIPSGYAYPVQVWQFANDLNWIALGGEVTVDYAIRLKRELHGNSWVSAYSNDVRGYVGSARILLEGGYEADHSTVYYGLPSRWKMDVEDRIVATVHQLIEMKAR